VQSRKNVVAQRLGFHAQREQTQDPTSGGRKPPPGRTQTQDLGLS